MKERLFLVSIGYNGYVILEDAAVVTHILQKAVPVKQEYTKGSYIYSPETDTKIKCETISTEDLRSLTKEEAENKALSAAEAQATWSKSQAEKLQKEVEELKCQLKVALTKEKEDEPR